MKEIRKFDLTDIDYQDIQTLIGFRDENLRTIAKAYGGEIRYKDGGLLVEMEESQFDSFARLLDQILYEIHHDHKLEGDDLALRIIQAKSENLPEKGQFETRPIVQTKAGNMIYPKSRNQAKLAKAFEDNDIIFSLGVAGTGKTYLAVAYAISQLKKQKIERLILTRPAVEAGESLGFLPGDMKEKVDPYLRPLYDALYEFLGVEQTERLIEKNVIEIAPLAFMRGRTLKQAIVILDEAQNTTKAQMKMFLTRMGKNCKLIINGDITQTDLLKKQDSGLLDAWNRLSDIDQIARIELGNKDVMRHPLVAKIIAAYEDKVQSDNEVHRKEG